MVADSLEIKALRQFDALVERGNLLYEENTPRLINDGGFNFQFRLTPALTKKPILKPSDPGRSTNTHAFSDTDPDFHLSAIGSSHTLILNKFCAVRPMLLLHTNTFVPQSDPLTEEDLSAAWIALQSLSIDKEYMVIYNCGVQAGSSQGHKHLQLLPRPSKEEFELWPNSKGIEEDTCTVTGIPFRHAANKLSPNPDAAELVEVYAMLKEVTGVGQNPAHNVILVKEWMLVIPRSQAFQGELVANAAGMVGMMWVNKEGLLEEWLAKGPMDLLCGFGVVDNSKA